MGDSALENFESSRRHDQSQPRIEAEVVDASGALDL